MTSELPQFTFARFPQVSSINQRQREDWVPRHQLLAQDHPGPRIPSHACYRSHYITRHGKIMALAAVATSYPIQYIVHNNKQ